MKIRMDFVTNSSSSSFLVAHIESNTLTQIMKPFVEENETLYCDLEIKDNVITFSGENVCSETPTSLSEIVDCLKCFDEDNEDFMNILEENETKIKKDIIMVDWHTTNYGRGEDESRYDESNYKKEDLENIYKEIAKIEDIDVSEVTEEDFAEYVCMRTSMETSSYYYSKKDKIEKAERKFELL